MAMDFPTGVPVGTIVTQGGNQYVWDGIAWNILPQQAPATLSDLPPSNPAVGQFWWRGTNGQLYVYVDDGNSQQWVQAAGSANAGLPFTKEFVSSQQTITSGGALTLAHGLGTAPKLVEYSLVCVVAASGYSVGDVVPWGTTQFTTAGATSGGLAATIDATNINIRFGAIATVFAINNKATGGVDYQTNANWRLIVRAWA